jgi:hypothetical protein
MPGLIHRLEVAALLVPLVGCALLVILASFGLAWQARGRKVR